MKRWTPWCQRMVWPLLLTALVPGAVTAQERAAAQPADRGGLNPDAFYGKETFQGVSVRDSLEAIKKLEDARRMERLKEWNKAADWYQEVIEKYGQYVVPSRVNAQKQTYQYTGIERPVQEQLAKWDAEGLQAYKNRYGPVADALLKNAARDDREVLSRVMKLYFVTDAGKAAGIRLMDLLLESGEFAEAARVGDRLLDWHPGLNVDTARVLFRTALAYHLAGDAAKARERADRLNSKFADATGSIFGRDVVLSQSLERLLGNAPPVSVQTRANSIRYNPGGNEERSMISSAMGRPGARMASIELAPPPVKVDPNQLKQYEQMGGSRVDGSGNLGILPVVDDDEMFFQDGCRVYAVSLTSGVPLPRWAQSYPNSNGQYVVNSYTPQRNQQHTLTLTDSSVLAIMGAPQQRSNPYGAQMPIAGEPGTRLVCLNRTDGKEKWVTRRDKIPDENLRQGLDFSGSPLVVGDNVYVIGRGGKNFNEDCYVLCFDLNSGAYKWSCFIASATTGQAYYYGQQVHNDTLSHLAYSSGRVYVVTNLGACAAIDAYAGSVSWLNIYPRDNQPANMEMGFPRRAGNATSVKAWEFNPIIVQQGRIFVLPTDGRQNLMIYDAATGAEIKRIAMADVRSADNDYDSSTPGVLLAVDGDELFLEGPNVVYCVNWRNYDGKKDWRDFTSWRTALARPDGKKAETRGRGFVTADSMFFCTDAKLYRIERRTGKAREPYPSNKDQQWSEADGEGPGNVIVTAERVVIAGASRVNVYADMTLARKRLDEGVAAAPTDPEPRLRYAEVMFVAGQLPVSLEKLNEAVQLLGGIKTLRSGEQRDHLFNDCISFATKLQRDMRGKPDVIDANREFLDKLYDLAADAADSDAQQVNYRMSRARFNRDFEQDDSFAQAVKLYQEILLSASLRAVPLADPSGAGTTQAGLLAEKLIAEVVKVNPATYEVFETQAAEMLAKAGVDTTKLQQVCDSYPNSRSAPRAMIAAASAFENKGDCRLAAHMFRQVYSKYTESADKATMLEGMARNYLAMPDRMADRVDTAAARLGTIVKLGLGDTTLARPLALADGTVLAEKGLPINQALKALHKFKTQAAASRLADLSLPRAQTDEDKQTYHRAYQAWIDAGSPPDQKPVGRIPAFVPAEQHVIVNDVEAIVTTPRELRIMHSRHDILGAWSKGKFSLYSAGRPQPVASSDTLTQAPGALAWIEKNQNLLVWSATELALLRGSNADKRWKVELGNLPRIEVASGGIEQTLGERVVVNRRGGVFINQAGAAAQPIAAPVGGPEHIRWVKPVDDRILVASSAGQLFAVKVTDGKVLWHTRLASTAPIDRMVANDDFVVCLLTDRGNTQIVVIDTLTGQMVRRMNFPREGGNVPVNLALSPDGMLVWTQSDRLCGKDLFEPRSELNYDVRAGNTDPRNPNLAIGPNVNPIYSGATQSDQLLISEGRILAVTHNGRYVSIHSLESGKLLDYKQPDGRSAEARFSTTGSSASASGMVNDWAVSLRVIGSYLYVTTKASGPVAYDLERPPQVWDGYIDEKPPIGNQRLVQYQDAIVSPTYFMVGVQRANPAGKFAPVVRMHCYSRAPGKNGKESGCLEFAFDLRDDAGISQIEPADGGLYYLAGDNRLHFVRGNGKPEEKK